MTNCPPIASLCLQKNKHLSALSREDHSIFLMLGAIHKRIGIVEELLPINSQFINILTCLSNLKMLTENENTMITNFIQNVIPSFDKEMNFFGVVIKTLNDDNISPLDVKMIRNKLSMKEFSIVYLNKITLEKIYSASSNFGDIFYYDELDLKNYHNEKIMIDVNLNIKRIIYMKEIDTKNIVSSIDNIITNCIKESFIIIKDNKAKILIPRSLLVKEDLFGKKESYYKKVLINISSHISFTLSMENKENVKNEIIERIKKSFDYERIEVRKTSDVGEISFEIRGKKYNNYVLNHRNSILSSSMNNEKYIMMMKELFPSFRSIEKDGIFYIDI